MKNNKKQIMVPYIENGEAKIIHWSFDSVSELNENIKANGTWGEILEADPLCRVWDGYEWKDEYLKDVLI